ncbi:MAG: hypothetical protein DMF69_01465 [Acidobacteria bacterium]|nr:MAG: hypothetical protein DMF69_01465 [Acidobacteriota bacterium]
MMNCRAIVLVISFLFCLSIRVTAQKSVSELPPSQTAVLQQFLTEHKGLEFLSETVTDKSILKDMRKTFGVNFRPFYRAGDFNHDGVADFAMILAKEGGPTGDQGEGIAETHRKLYDMTVVIFNGVGKTYRPAFIKTTKAPRACFLNTTNEKRKRLTFGVYETDDGFVMTPAGKVYIIENGDK